MRFDSSKNENKLSISVKVDGETICIEIEDSGEGISEDDLGKIFKHGFTTKNDGFGFGLHSAANFLAEMGATIAASSEGKGKGATFFNYLSHSLN